MNRRRALLTALVLAAAGCGSGAAARAEGQVAAYPVAPGVARSPDYQLKAGGKAIFVYHTPAFSLATFSSTGDADVLVTVQRPILRPVVRPVSRGIKPVVEGNTVRFRVRGVCQLALEVDEDLRRPLFLFVNPPEPKAPRAGTPGVRYFEGGRVHEVGRIELADRETLYLAGGAVVRGVIRAKQVSRARILGPGILDGSTRDKQARMIQLDSCSNIEINGPIVLGSYGWTIVPRLSRQIVLRNVKVLSWRDNDDGCDPDSSRQVLIDNCFFRTKDDCIAVKAHGNAGVAGERSTGDPSQFDTDDVRVTGSVFWSSEWGHALTVGFAIRAPSVRNVVFRDCDIIKKERGPALSVDNHDLGTVDGVRFEDIRVEDGCDKLLAVKVAFSEYSADCPFDYFRNNPARRPPQGAEWLNIQQEKRSSPRGTIRNVVFKDIQIGGDRLPDSEIRGFSPQNEVRDVLLQNVRFRGKVLNSPQEANLRIHNAANVRFAP